MTTWVITGANRGIGLEMARQVAARGDMVVAGSRSLDHLPHDVPPSVRFAQLDVASTASIIAFAETLTTPVDVLVNNAGITQRMTTFETLAMDTIKPLFDVNVLGVLRVTQALFPKLKEAMNPKIVNVSSHMGSVAESSGGHYGYRASKCAVNMLTASLAHDFPFATFVAISPGWVRTEMGGADAPVSAPDAATAMVRRICSLGAAASGRFLDLAGNPIPW